MLPQTSRIKKKKDFETIFKNSKSFKTNLFIFKIMKNELGLSRFGFVVSKKISTKATVRNKVRRRLSEIMKAESKNIKSGIDLIIVTLSGIEKKEFSDIKYAVTDALLQARLIVKNQNQE